MAITINYQFSVACIVIVWIIFHRVMDIPFFSIFNNYGIVRTTTIISWVYSNR